MHLPASLAGFMPTVISREKWSCYFFSVICFDGRKTLRSKSERKIFQHIESKWSQKVAVFSAVARRGGVVLQSLADEKLR
jgi:hypothetical protein